MIAKQELRHKMRGQRDGLSDTEIEARSEIACGKIKQLVEKLKPSVVHTFIPMGSEVNIMPVIAEMLKKGIIVVAPKTLKGRKLEHLILSDVNELEEGIFGTLHPAGNKLFKGDIGLILIPGLAFDASGNRLGYGAGYYDTFMKNQAQAFKAGVSYSFQIVDEVPTEPHDITLDQIIVG